ncbi:MULTISPECIES: aminopeptidase N [Rhodococcus]|uniref:Aminopeptidase N n=1 Tax=Rhodococcus oxybenzonivorans TaxID=1990687 RepID=A0AAE4V3Z2_9NOCA|nr:MULTISPECIES: aminopeptidase N [Rhodococcus]MDV7245073.1 aminopeptidase N [Rhodococcus oxybenzonivorans]MDV7267970.1 aminopeptidase N [Rhodococcus oxybenzonivorans]MDV7272644.1 aminopeptidase N [Rhodococcus oxybenzonivorans]MDV7336098.1 aminopeptidase N [Rhodococcus oxybenzonivorans]MDV7342785.1 aminopeptidase N [Rhodococcus oxybenzonivorans]
MSTANLSRAETAERSRSIEVLRYRVELDLLGAVDPGRDTFSTTTTVEFSSRSPDTWLDFIGTRVESVTVDGTAVGVQYDGARIALTGLRESSVVTVVAHGDYSRSGEGLHRFVDPSDAQTYLYTQYEPADARRVFPCFEQPDLKASFTFVVTAPRGWEVISNQHVDRRDTVSDGQVVTFAATLPLSTYLTAIVAGPYHRVESSWQRGNLTVPLSVLCRASLARYLDAGTIFEITQQGLDFFADAFDYPYPWGKYDQVFVPEYNLGAMENPGCVTFTEAYVFRGAATDAQYEGRANTILHEMAHMWFGDLVTMVWWDDLWLKESFADYMGSLASAEATRWTQAWVAFADRRKAWAYLQDQLPTTHPIVADIVDLEAAKLNFDGITYAKGASVLKQLASYVGRDAFFEGARRYFRAHAFGNTTLADLLTELSGTSGRDLTSWAKAWLQTSGVSTLALERNDGGGASLSQTDPRPHRLAIGMYDFDEAGDLVCTERTEIDITTSRTPVDLTDAPLVLPNDADLTYAKVRLDTRSLTTVENSLDRVRDPLARGLIWSSLWNATRDSELEAARYLAMAQRFSPTESNPALLTSVLSNVPFAIEHYLPESARADARRRWLEHTWNEMFVSDSGDQLTWARAVAAVAATDGGRAAHIRSILDGSAPPPSGLSLDPDLRWAFWLALAATGHADDTDLHAEWQRDDTGSGRTAYLRAMSARPEVAVKAEAWASIFHDHSLSNDHLDATISGFLAGARRDLVAPFAADYFAAVRPIWRDRSIEMARRVVTGLFPRETTLAAADAWLAANADAPGALRRLIVEQRDHLARDLRAQEFNCGFWTRTPSDEP